MIAYLAGDQKRKRCGSLLGKGRYINKDADISGLINKSGTIKEGNNEVSSVTERIQGKTEKMG